MLGIIKFWCLKSFSLKTQQTAWAWSGGFSRCNKKQQRKSPAICLSNRNKKVCQLNFFSGMNFTSLLSDHGVCYTHRIQWLTLTVGLWILLISKTISSIVMQSIVVLAGCLLSSLSCGLVYESQQQKAEPESSAQFSPQQHFHPTNSSGSRWRVYHEKSDLMLLTYIKLNQKHKTLYSLTKH